MLLKTAFRWIYGLCASLGFLLILITVTPLLDYWTTALSTPWGSEDGDILIVPGSGAISKEMVGMSSYWRSFYAALVWKRAHFRQIVVSGKDVAPLMRDLMVGQGVPKEAILVEDAAGSTRENAIFVARLLQTHPGRSVLLTSDYHMGRALGVFNKAGVDASPLPFPDARKRVNDVRERWTVFCMLADETAKVLVYKARGWT